MQVENLMRRIYRLRSKRLCQPLYSENEFNIGLKLLNCNAGSAFVYLSLLKYYFTFFLQEILFQGHSYLYAQSHVGSGEKVVK